MIYTGPGEVEVPKLDLLSYIFDSPHCKCTDDTPVHAEAHDPSKVLTRGDVRRLTKQIAYFLRHTYGIGANGPDKDVVVTVSSGQRALASLFYAVLAAEGIYSAASPAATASDLKRQALDGPGKIFVCSADVKAVVAEAAKAAGMPRKNVLVLESWPEVKLASIDGDVVCSFDKTLDWKPVTNPEILANRTACILYSSGTTGLPKGVCISHENLVAESHLSSVLNRPVSQRWAAEGNPFERRTLGHLPVAHVAGLQGYLVNEIAEGGIVYWMPKFNFDEFLDYVEKLKITFFFSVPPIYIGIVKHPRVKDQFKHMRSYYSGAAPLGKDIQLAVSKKVGVTLTQVWGLSETCGTVTVTPLDRTDTVGSLSPLMPNMRMRLVDEDGEDVAPGEPGEAYLKGPVVTKGYHNNEKANKDAFTEDGWFKTGDILKVEHGLLYIVDRKKELIKYKGLQVAPAELEGLLESHEAVADAAVIGVPQDDDEVPRAYVVLTPNAKGKVTGDDIAEWIKAKVARHKWLRGGVHFVDVVPRSPSGKILRRELRDLAKRANKL